MFRSRRVRRYQEFLKTLRRPEPELCSCPLHLHPRPWVPPPCRTSRPHGEPSLVASRRFHSDPELVACSQQSPRMERGSSSRRSGKARLSQDPLQHLYSEARVIKEALNKIRQGDNNLSKDTYNTVKKWSKKLPEEEESPRKRKQRREKKPSVSHSKHEERVSERDLQKEEEELREELRNVRELAQSNTSLIEENKKLMRKIQRLQQRVKRQEEAGKGSRESVAPPREPGTREDYVILSLKKKYDDLLQYVLKVEAENQKLNSLIGASGERRTSLNSSDHENAEHGRQAMAELQSELQALRGQLAKKDEHIMQCDQQLRTLRDTIAFQESMKSQFPGDAQRPDTASLEEEWMRRLTETREMYDQAIQGYKAKVEEEQGKLIQCQQDHARQMEELKEELLAVKTQSESKSRAEEPYVQPDDGDGISRNNSPKNVADKKSGQDQDSQKGDKHEQVEGGSLPPTTKNGLNARDEKESEPKAGRTDERHSEALELIVKRLESLQVGGEEVETTLAVIKDTINTCLREWKENFHEAKAKEGGSVDELRRENDEMQRKLKGKNKKIETQHNQIQDLQQQNAKLLHQCSLAESRMTTAHTAEQLELLSDLPKKVQEAEQQLINTKELLHKAQVEKQAMQSQIKQQEEKLNKKEFKLRAEREQSANREKESSGLRETISSLHHQLEEVSRELTQLQEQLATKDNILEHTSAQLEERIRECASLSSLIERYKLQQNQDSDRIQTQLNERDNASHKQFLEAQAQASRYQAQLSALRSEKEQCEKSLRCAVRKLEEQVDQLQLRNATLQRQLTTITSTYNTMFSGVDLQPAASTVGTSVLKGI